MSSYARWMVGGYGSGGGARSGASRAGGPAHDRDLASEQHLLLAAIAALVDAVAAYGPRGECQYQSVGAGVPDGACAGLLGAMHALAHSLGSPGSGIGGSPVLARGHIGAVVTEVSAEAGRCRLRGVRLRPGLLGSESSVLVIADRLDDDAIDRARIRERFRLTQRQAEVAVLLADRRHNAEIARTLGISLHTARHHVERVLLKLGGCKRHDVPRVLRSGLDHREDSIG